MTNKAEEQRGVPVRSFLMCWSESYGKLPLTGLTSEAKRLVQIHLNAYGKLWNLLILTLFKDLPRTLENLYGIN